MEYACLYTIVTTDDQIERIGPGKAELAMENMCDNWIEQDTEWGTVYIQQPELAVYIDELGEERAIPNTRRDGQKLRHNDVASRFFKVPIYGTVFIHPYLEKAAYLEIIIRKG